MCQTRADSDPRLSYISHHQFGMMDKDCIPMERVLLSRDGLHPNFDGSRVLALNILQMVQTLQYLMVSFK